MIRPLNRSTGPSLSIREELSIWLAKGEVLSLKKEGTAAVSAFDQALGLDPKSADAAFNKVGCPDW